MFFILVPVPFCSLCNFLRNINIHTGDYERPTADICRAAHNILYKKKHTPTNTSYPAMDISCMSSLNQGAGCRSRSRGRALYRNASRASYVLGPPPSKGGDLELECEFNESL